MRNDPFASSRRRFVQGLASLLPLAGIEAAALSGVAACTPAAPPAAAAPTPVFFTAAEMGFLSAACERLIPADETGPGAAALHVPRFIDLQMETPYGFGHLWYMQGPFLEGPATLGYQLPYAPRELYRRGIAEAQAWVQATYGRTFDELGDATKDEALTLIETGKAEFADVPSATFFAQLLQNTMEGAFSDPIHGGNHQLGGWTMIGFPGARADFMDWAERGERYPLGAVSISGETA